jgi:hypothetical protein
MPTNIEPGTNLYNLAGAVDAVYYSPNSKDEEIRKKYKDNVPEGWVLLGNL